MQADQPDEIKTNENQINAPLSGNAPIAGGNKNEGIKMINTQETNPAFARTNAPQPQDPKFQGVGRNDPCPCGSNKKFKKCHGA
jgi:preprotein translocase subunit SecA